MNRTISSSMTCLFAVLFSVVAVPSFSQDVTLFFSAGNLSGEPDRFGNSHTVAPEDAIEPRPFGNEALADVFFDEDNLWLIFQVEGNIFLVSHSPGFFEDAPELTMEISPAIPGRYEVILNYLDSNSDPGTGPIQAAIGDEDLTLFSGTDGVSVAATGGTTPGFPQFGGVTAGTMWWYTVSLGEVVVEEGGTVRVRVDDVPGDQFGIDASAEVTTTFNGVTLRAIELEGTIPEIQVAPVSTLVTDIGGNQFRTAPQDEAAFPNESDWLTITTREDGSGKWNTRAGLGPFGPIFESFPNSGNDAIPLRTTVTFAGGGTFNVFFSLGDTGAANPQENLDNPNPLLFGREGEELRIWVAGDGVFKGTPGYNDYEIFLEQVTVSAGDTLSYIIDDVQEAPGGIGRSVYLGMRFELLTDGNPSGVSSWSLY